MAEERRSSQIAPRVALLDALQLTCLAFAFLPPHENKAVVVLGLRMSRHESGLSFINCLTNAHPNKVLSLSSLNRFKFSQTSLEMSHRSPTVLGRAEL